jgi:proteasome accessory factor B
MKMESVLPESIRRHVGSVIDQVHVSLGPLSRHDGLEDMFDQLSAAIVDRRVCKLIYLSFADRKQVTMTVHPLRLMFMGRAWYLLAHSAAHGQLRTFKLARVRKLTVTDRTFDPPPQADLDKHFGQAWSMIPEGKMYDVHLRFDRKVAGNVAEVQWHPSQKVQWNDDGSIDFQVRVDGLGEISWWVMGYGPSVEVISPPPLRRMLADAAEKVLGMYRGGPA